MSIENGQKWGFQRKFGLGRLVGQCWVALPSRIRCSGARRPLEILSAPELRKLFLDQLNNILNKAEFFSALLNPGSGSDMAVGDFPSSHDHSSPPLD